MPPSRPSLAIACATVAALACHDQSIVESVAVAIAAGTVTDASGTPVAGAVVGWAECAAPAPDAWPDTTDAAGTYRLQMTLFPSSGTTLCVLLLADPPAGVALASDTARVENMVFSGAHRMPGDSVHVDFQLGKAP